MKRMSAALIITLLGGAGLWVGCESGAAGNIDKKRIAVRTAEITYQTQPIPVLTSGKLAAAAETKLSFKIGGIVERILVDEGARVRRGQLLAKLNLAEIEAQVRQARSGFEKAERDLDRVTRLYADSVATLEQHQDAQTAVDMARSSLEIAEFNLRYASITAPTDGRIMKRFMEENELLGSGQPVFLFASQGGAWIIRAGLSDRDILDLQLGDSAHVTFDAYPGERFLAYVTELAEGVDPMSGTFEAELTLIRTPRRLISGFVGSLSIFPSRSARYAILPVEALVEGDGARGYVYVPAADRATATRREIAIAHIGDDYLAIVPLNDKISEVITSGSAYLTEGASITIRGERGEK